MKTSCQPGLPALAGVISTPVSRIDPQYRPAWDGFSPAAQQALASYYLPHRSRQPWLGPTRPRLIKWYCPFADQARFPTGHRYCINVYTGCAHGCRYCYATGYGPEEAGCKKDFPRLLAADLADLEQFDVPPAPVHISNSTDPFQPLELAARHTLMTLEAVLAHRRRFTTVVILTRNPLLATRPEYLRLLQSLNCSARVPGGQAAVPGGIQVEVSLAFWREAARTFWDPHAPSVQERIEGLRVLRNAGLPVILRIDPLFPRSDARIRAGKFGLVEAQSAEDLEQLVLLARELQAVRVVYSTVKIVKPRYRALDGPRLGLKHFCEELAAGGKLPFRGGSWRLPGEYAQAAVVEPFLEVCDRLTMPAAFCMANLLATH